VKERFSEAQILSFLREAAAGASVMELCWNHCFSRSTFRAWKARYGEAIDAEIGRPSSSNSKMRACGRRSPAPTQISNGCAGKRPARRGRRKKRAPVM